VAAGGTGDSTARASALVFTPRERWGVTTIYVAIGVATVAGLVATFLIGRVYGVFIGLGLLSYTLGLRHAVDADHIVAIDNTTRKLLQQGKRPYTVGAWFSLGHSTVVVALLAALVLAERWILTNVPAFESIGTVLGTAISGAFLYLIAVVNLLIFLEIYRIFRRLRSGAMRPGELEEQLNQRGFMNRYFNFLFRVVNEPWQIYPVGLLFGLGFDTASEVILIATVLFVAKSSIPLWMILVLPFLFTCGMVAIDTADGISMRFAYGWAFLKPIRKVYYNLTMTVISVLVAFVVGTVEILGVIAAEFGLTGGPFGFWTSMNWVNSSEGPAGLAVWGWVGVGIVLLFVGCWLAALLVYRWKGYESRGFGPDEPPGAPPPPLAPGVEAEP
jgi:nickel/cobalt transporter (NiCoT) family protein